MFPRELVRKCLNESNRNVDLLVEPFLGSGTTLATCLEEKLTQLVMSYHPSTFKT